MYDSYNPWRTFINILKLFSMIKASYFWAIIDLQIEQKSIQNSILLHFSG
ncbi:hypothetical protein J521_1334 [Acinetobacter baumannii 1035119]|nr:hypothetical protein J521_1334 [Acinetobacter baumannii 1035119]